ncbi:hypothetical protein Thimo_0682 [Thioflavicoccus mobilis 8321]|uniref:Toxin CptA n=1 Tax=Thioflavicoccus mobilis 8321 TaxID=765912 RepID=L0GU78_9GAMM|nr:protein YgfX [Thioflavicoccus mobilis]AGA89521.1 hypothetical protein Thimo_0682 [Thioflavicoccus mobilis 8321]
MTARQAPPPLRIRPRPSGRLAALLAASHGSALLLVAALPITWLARATLATLILLSLVHEALHDLWPRLPWAVREALWQPDGTWLVTLASGRQREARLGSATFVTVGLILLDLRCGPLRRCRLALFADSLDGEQHRRLRARLRAELGQAGSPRRLGGDIA